MLTGDLGWKPNLGRLGLLPWPSNDGATEGYVREFLEFAVETKHCREINPLDEFKGRGPVHDVDGHEVPRILILMLSETNFRDRNGPDERMRTYNHAMETINSLKIRDNGPYRKIRVLVEKMALAIPA
ncbi:hypothetical protein [Agrobacterium rubi]|uniref:hypothetical protein n=1 Tax=Agrobacterium rubi TaxID=28099 RepID=UPI00201B837B|nr:hypothetical protein [Agrobacterium rubi]